MICCNWYIIKVILIIKLCENNVIPFIYSFTFQRGRTLRSSHGIFVYFNKICMFCDKCCVCIDKCVFIVIKIKYVNSDRICDICDKVNFTTKLYTFYNIWKTFIKIHITFYQNTHKYYQFWHTDGPATGHKNFHTTRFNISW